MHRLPAVPKSSRAPVQRQWTGQPASLVPANEEETPLRLPTSMGFYRRARDPPGE